MIIGISALFKGSAFNASLPQVAVFFGRALQSLGHTVHFILPADSDDWFTDCSGVPGIDCVKLTAGANVIFYDLVIEICWFVPPEVRRQIANRVVMFYHESPTFHDMEKSVYKSAVLIRNFKGVDAIWTWTHFHDDDINYLSVLSRLPVYSCPYIWEPFFVEQIKVNDSVDLTVKPHIIICENNRSNSSSCVIPLTILSEIKKDENDVEWSVMNAVEIYKRQYFIKNIVENLYLGSDISGNFMGRVRIVDFMIKRSCILSHQRWLPIKYMLLDALWLGIPLIHNCELIKSIPGGEHYYDLNRIDQALTRWDTVKKEKKIDKVRLNSTRDALNLNWGPEEFKRAIPNLLDKLSGLRDTILRVAFCDMWEGFNQEHNFFVGAFKFAGIKFTKDLLHPNLVIFGPFGNSHEKFKFIPKIYYTGENLPPSTDSNVKFNIGFSYIKDDNYFRIPNWLLELNLFSIDEKAAANPIPFNPKLLFRKKFGARNKFCIFVASRVSCVERNTVYNTLMRYKKVDSAGTVFNNSEWIPAGPGGSGGQPAKVKAYENYKFAIVGENSKADGYVTEKLLHAKLAGCVPIYWGDPSVNLEFEKGSFINVSDFATEEDLLTRISYLDTNDTAWLAIANTPLLKEEKLVAWKEKIAKFCVGCLNLVKPQIKERIYYMEPIKLDCGADKIIVTACNGKFIDSVIRLVKSKPTGVDIYVWVWDMKKSQKEALLRAGAKQVFEFDVSWQPLNFPDFWSPEHYCWKPLLWGELGKNGFLRDGLSILYLDAGIEIVGDLTHVWSSIANDDIFVCNIEHKMVNWCKPEFYNLTKMTKVEGDTLQYSSAIVGFKIGGKFKDVFTTVATYGKDPNLICGKKWYRFSNDCYGHRQDQSILSIVGIRASVPVQELAKFCGEICHSDSLRDGKLFYLHRGLWKKTLIEEIDGIDSIQIVNLAHRADRLDKFYEAHPFLKAHGRFDAVYGKDLVLNSEIVHLFRNNDFNWKKGVIGCALSHYELWKKVASGLLGQKVLIFEDDALLAKGFASTWNNIVGSIPTDSDIIMLGGVLPPNKQMLPVVTEKVNDYFGKIKPHMIGGILNKTFHFCTYSYVITVTGAKKLCQIISEKGIFTSIDHMIVNHMNDLLNVYFTTPLLSGCFQDNDKAYVEADFNNFNRIDTYDSEIWNNNDIFTCTDLSGLLPVIYFEHGQNTSCLEQAWLESLIGRQFLWIKNEELLRLPKDTVVCVYYQHTTIVALIETWIAKNSTFKLILLHLSDESCNSDVRLYNNGSIKKVFRNYWRPEVVCEKVVHLPLGYNKSSTDVGKKPLATRKHIWSFSGAMDRPLRKEILDSIESTGVVGKLHKTPTWNSDANLSGDDYMDILGDSKIVACLPGFSNVETYRFYEALEAGAIPVVPLDDKSSLTNILSGSLNPPLLAIGGTDWSVIGVLGTQESVLNSTGESIQQWWVGYKLYLKKLVQGILSDSL